jgi:hypothetical protein
MSSSQCRPSLRRRYYGFQNPHIKHTNGDDGSFAATKNMARDKRTKAHKVRRRNAGELAMAFWHSAMTSISRAKHHQIIGILAIIGVGAF